MNDLIDFVRTGEIFIFANTPRYIIKNLKREQFVLNLSLRFKGDFLFEEIKRVCENDEISFDEYIKIYVLIIAISLQNDEKSKIYIEEFGATNFRWAKEISKILIGERIETNVTVGSGYNIITTKNTGSNLTTNVFSKNRSEPTIKILEG